MSEALANPEEEPRKKGKTGLIISVLLAIAGAGAGYFVTTSGLLSGGEKAESTKEMETDDGMGNKAGLLPDVAFVDLPPVIVSLEGRDARHLKFHAQLEVNASYASEVEKMRPRIVDLMNGYLRALETADLEDSLALTRIRGHLTRRIDIVVGKGRVRDVLVMEFVMN